MNEPRDRPRQSDLFRDASGLGRGPDLGASRAVAGGGVEPREETPPEATVDHYGGVPPETRLYRLPIVALDFETTGLAAHRGDAACEVGLVAGSGDKVEVLLSAFVDPGRPLSPKTRELTGIRDSDVAGAPRLAELVPEIMRLIGARPLVMHNAPFDLHFLAAALAQSGHPPCNNLAVDTLLMARFIDRNREGNSLRQTADRYGIARARAHRAADDAQVAALAYHALVPYLELRGVRTVGDLVRGRMAGAAGLFAARPSSMLLDMASRALGSGAVLDLLYATRPGARGIERRLRPERLEGERYLVGWDPDLGAERTYRLDRILILADGRATYMSPWVLPDEVPSRFR